MTETQKSILAFINERLRGGGSPPTLREIGARFGIASTGSVSHHLRALEEAGALKRRDSTSRGIELSQDPFSLPILSRVGAGPGMVALENAEGRLNFRNFLLGADFLLRVKGDSMEGAGILEGDLVQVRRQPTAEDGDIVVALVDGEEGVVKRLKRRGRSGYALESANPRHRPIDIGFQVVGKVVGLVRHYDR